jgi:hypothetical protein
MRSPRGMSLELDFAAGFAAGFAAALAAGLAFGFALVAVAIVIGSSSYVSLE